MAQAWTIDPNHSQVMFKIGYMGLAKVKGEFDNFVVDAKTKSTEFKEPEVNVSIDINSVNTSNDTRDEHLKSEDFFNSERFPRMHFESKEYKNGVLIGDLTIKNNTHEIKLDTDFVGIRKDKDGNEKAGFDINGKIDRKKFGLEWDGIKKFGDKVIDDDVYLDIDIQLNRIN